MILSQNRAASNSRIIGIDTKNRDSGSGGENAAPRTNVANQMCLRYSSKVALSTAPDCRESNVIRGAWNPITQAKHKLTMKPMNEDNLHSVERPAAWASFARYSRSIGVSKYHE